jgi:HTH-type transcriptional regulator/antitoxin HigA
MERVTMLKSDIKKIITVWPKVSSVIYVPHTEKEYNQLVVLLDSLIDEVGENEDYALASLMDIIGVLIEKYETDRVPELA